MSDLRQFTARQTVKVTAETPIAEVYNLMTQMKIRHVPVVTDGTTLIGIISDRDVFKRWNFELNRPLSDLTAKEIMTTDVITADLYMSMEDIALTLTEAKINCLPVVHASGKLLGMVTTSDALRYLCEQQLSRGIVAKPQFRKQV